MGGIDSSEASDGSHLCHFAFTALYREKMATRSPPSFGEWLWQQLSAKSMREPAGQLYRDHRGESILATDGGGPKAALWLSLRNRAAAVAPQGWRGDRRLSEECKRRAVAVLRGGARLHARCVAVGGPGCLKKQDNWILQYRHEHLSHLKGVHKNRKFAIN